MRGFFLLRSSEIREFLEFAATENIKYIENNLRYFCISFLITNLLQEMEHVKVSDLIARYHFTINILERLGIGLGVEDKSLDEICKENNVNTTLVVEIFKIHLGEKRAVTDEIDNNCIMTVIDYLVNSHNYYQNEAIPNISGIIEEVIQGEKDAAFMLLNKFFKEYKTEVDNHLKYEEETVFPYALAVVKGESVDKSYHMSDYKTNHDDIETKLDDLKNLLIKYLPAKESFSQRRKLLFDLFRLEKDLKIHTVIEEQILIPAIEKLEVQLNH